MRHGLLTATTYMLLAFSGASLAMLTAQESKFSKTYTPIGWKKLNLTKEQSVKISEIHEKTRVKIMGLQKQIDILKIQERAEQIKILTTEQKATLRKLAGVDDPVEAKKE